MPETKKIIKKGRRGGVLVKECEEQTSDTDFTNENQLLDEAAEDSTPSKSSSFSEVPSFQVRRATKDNISTKRRKASQNFKCEYMGVHRNSFSGTPRQLREGPSKKSLLQPEKRRYSVVRIKSNKSMATEINKLTPASEALTRQQINAFKEAFDLFDKNGGGTIDALELKKTLESVGIILEEEEIHDVMMRLDKDGNGEIDFEEFLNMMTNTEMFLEAFASRHGTKKSSDLRREQDVLLFDALTEFMKKSALKDAHEIVGYYTKTYRKVVKSYNKNKGAHVVGHYADGARLIGLTEKQLVMQLRQLTLSQNYGDEGEKDSPYAQPLHLSMLRSVTTHGSKFHRKFLKKKKRTSKRASSVGDAASKASDSISITDDNSSTCSTMQRNYSVVSAPPTIPHGALRRHTSEGTQSRKKGKIILKIINNDLLRKENTEKHDEQELSNDKQKKKSKAARDDSKDQILEHKPGWLSQRNIMYNVDISMPTRYRRVQVDVLPRLRKKVDEVKCKFSKQIAKKKIQQNIRHYRELDSRRIPSPALNEQFLRVFCAYSCAETNNRTAVSIEQLKKVGATNRFSKSKDTTYFYPQRMGKFH